VYGREMLEHMFTALSQGNNWAAKAAMIVAVASRKDLDCLLTNREYYLFDTGMATAFLMLRATELNLVCHPIAGYDEEKVKTILEIPDDFTIITLLIVGKKSDQISPLLSEKMAESETKRPQRRQFAEFCFVDKYKAG
jgi:nitroreductase